MAMPARRVETCEANDKDVKRARRVDLTSGYAQRRRARQVWGWKSWRNGETKGVGEKRVTGADTVAARKGVTGTLK